MSFFKTYWVVLKIHSQKETEFLFDIFSYEYGKIKLKSKKSKKEKSLDIWYIIDFEINVKKDNTIHEIKNIKIRNEFSYLNKNYSVLLEYLELIKLVFEKCPNNMPIYEIFHIFNEINILEKVTDEKIIFLKLKVCFILWILKIENKNENIQKILSFISKESIKNILKLKWLTQENKIELNNVMKNL